MRIWAAAGAAFVFASATLGIAVPVAAAEPCAISHPPGYADRVAAALASGTDTWGDELIASPGGPTYEGAAGHLAPLGKFHDPGGRSPATGMHYIPLGQPDLTSANSTTNPFGSPVPPTETWTGGRKPWTNTAEVALHVADGSQLFSNYMLPTSYADGINSNQVTVKVGAGGDEVFGSCQSRSRPATLDAGLPILTTSYRDDQGVQYQQESFATRVPEIAQASGTGNLVSFLKLTVSRAASPATRVKVDFALGNPGLAVASNRLIDHNHRASPGEVDVVFSPGGSYTSPTLSYSLDLSNGQPQTVYLVRLNQPTSSVGAGLTADAGRYEAARASVKAYWTNLLAQGASFSVPDPHVMDAQRGLLTQSLLLGLNYSVANNYASIPFMPEDIWPLTTLGEYGFDRYEEIGLENLRDYTQQDLVWGPGPRPGFEGLFRGVKMEAAAEWYWRTRDAADFDRYFTPVFRQWAGEFRQQMAANDGLLQKEFWAGDFGGRCYSLPYNQAHGWKGLTAVVQVWKSIAADAALAGTYEPVANQLGQSIADAVAQGQTTLPDGSVFVPPCLRNSGPSPDPSGPSITATEQGAYWNLVMPDAFASGLIVPRSAQAAGILQYLATRGSRLLGMLRFGQHGTNTTAGADNVYLWNTVRFLADNDQADQLALTLYGLLGAGLTPGTFSSGEGSTIAPVDGEYYRQMTRSPNATTTAAALETLRLMLVHTTTAPRGATAAGAPDGLQLAFGTPGSWLAAGKEINVARAPTGFGPVSYSLKAVSAEQVNATVDVPPSLGGAPLKLRVRRPPGTQLTRVTVNGVPHQGFSPETGTVDLRGLGGRLSLTTTFAAVPPRAPGAPAGVSATAGDGQASVSWSPPASDGGSPVTSYTVTASPGGRTCTTTIALSCTVSGLANGTRHSFTVTAANRVGPGPPSSRTDPVVRLVPPAAPAAPPRVVTAGGGQVTVTWPAPVSDGGSPVTGYTVHATPGGRTCTTAGAVTCTVSGLTDGTVYTFAVVATNAVGSSAASAPSSAVMPVAGGYRFVAADGGIFSFGGSGFLGSTGGTALHSPIVGMAETPTRNGYWLVAADGGIFAFGDALFRGSTGGSPLSRPIVGMEATPSGQGYWLVGADGAIFAFGDADNHGTTGHATLHEPIVGMERTASGHGYWLVAADGGMFAFGDAAFSGSMGGTPLARPIVGMERTASGRGYWLVASDGGIFAFGDASFEGSMGGTTLDQPIVGMARTPSGRGYWMVAADGGVFALGDAVFAGSTGGTPLLRPIVGMAG